MAGQGATPSLYCTCLVSVSLLKIVEKNSWKAWLSSLNMPQLNSIDSSFQIWIPNTSRSETPTTQVVIMVPSNGFHWN